MNIFWWVTPKPVSLHLLVNLNRERESSLISSASQIITPGSQTTLAQLGLPESFVPARLRIPTRMFPAEIKGEWEPMKVRERRSIKPNPTQNGINGHSDGDVKMVDGSGIVEDQEDEVLFEEDPTSDDGAVYPIQDGRIVEWSCFFALLTHVYNTLSPPFHTPILIIAQPAWTAQDHESLTQFFFEKFKTPAFCLMDAALAVCYAYATPTATVIDVGYSKCDVSTINDFVINDLGRGAALSDCGGEAMTRRLLEILERKGFTREMCEQLKKNNICEILPPGSEPPPEGEGENPASVVSTGATGPGEGQRGSIAAQGGAPRGPGANTDAGNADEDRDFKDGEDEEGVLDVATIVASGKTSEFLARKEKEKADKAANKKAIADAAAAVKEAKLPNSKRAKATFIYHERKPLEELNVNGKRLPDGESQGDAPKRQKTPELAGNSDSHTAENAAAAAARKEERREERRRNREGTAFVRKHTEVGLERFEAASDGIIDRIADAIHRCILSFPDPSKRSDLWDSLIILGNGSKIKGFKEALIATLNARYLISPSSATIFTSELPSNFTTPVATGANTPQPQQHAPHHGSGKNPLLLAATNNANLAPPGQQPQQLHQQLQQQQMQNSHQHSSHAQTPTSIKLLKMPEYFPEWKEVGMEEAGFLGAQVAAKVFYQPEAMQPPSPSISPPPFKCRRITSPLPHKITHPPSTPPIPPGSPLDSSQVAKRSSLRIFSWNINGIHPFLPSTTPQITKFFPSTSKTKASVNQPSLRVNLRRWQWPNIVFLQEVKIARSDTKTPSLLRQIVNKTLDIETNPLSKDELYDVHLCLPRDRYNASGFGGKVYGVCALIRKDLAPNATVKTVDWDAEGRIQILEIARSKLVVINIYAVNGTANDYRDPGTGKVVGNRHDRKRAFHSLLAAEVRAYEDQGWGVVVAGDINISRSNIDSFPQLRMSEDHVKNRADFEEKFIRRLSMLDSFRSIHGEVKKFTYRPTNKPWGTGGDRVDMILISKGLRDSVTESDILDNEMERGPSDHVPLFIEIDNQDCIRKPYIHE
ncbi:Actin-like protein arp9 [Lecanora helva]